MTELMEKEALERFVWETYGTRETLGDDKYCELLGFAKVQQEYFRKAVKS